MASLAVPPRRFWSGVIPVKFQVKFVRPHEKFGCEILSMAKFPALLISSGGLVGAEVRAAVRLKEDLGASKFSTRREPDASMPCAMSDTREKSTLALAGSPPPRFACPFALSVAEYLSFPMT